MRARFVVLLVFGAMVVALGLAALALAAHSMTSPSVAGSYSATNHSGSVAFYYSEKEKKHSSVTTITKLRFHDGCTKALTKIKSKIHVRKNNRFGYSTELVTIAGKLFFHQNSNYPVIKGTVTLTDLDCPADPNGVITFKAAS